MCTKICVSVSKAKWSPKSRDNVKMRNAQKIKQNASQKVVQGKMLQRMFSIYFIKLRYNLPEGQLGLDCRVRLRRKETRCHRVRIIFYIFGASLWVTLLMETGLLHDFFGKFSTGGEKYYFGMEGARKVRLNIETIIPARGMVSVDQMGEGGWGVGLERAAEGIEKTSQPWREHGPDGGGGGLGSWGQSGGMEG